MEFRSLLLTVRKADTFAFAVPNELSCCATLGAGTPLESEFCPTDLATFETDFDTAFCFPYSRLNDKTLTLAIKGRDGVILGMYTLDMAMLLERDTSPSMQCKLRNPATKAPVCILRAKIRLSGTVVAGPHAQKAADGKSAVGAAATIEAEDDRPSPLLMMNNTPDVVQNRELSGIVTSAIELQLFHISDFLDAADEVSVRMGEYRYVCKMKGRNLNSLITMAYKGQRFVRFDVLHGGQTVGLGAIDLTKFVTNRANVIGGSLAIEDVESIGGRTRQMGVLYFRLQRFTGERKDGQADIIDDEAQKFYYQAPAEEQLGGVWS